MPCIILRSFLTDYFFLEPATVFIAGDLFEKEEDIDDPELWKSAGSENPALQVSHRARAVSEADFIVPGHGPMFKVTEEHRKKLLSDA
jgi:hypothetical protein